MNSLLITLREEFIVIERAVVGRNTVEVPHIDCLRALFVGQEGFVHLLTMTDTNDLDIFFLTAKEFANGFSLSLDGAGGSFLDEDIAVLAVLEGEKDEVNCFVEGHDEAGHGRFGEGNGLAVADLVYPEGDDAAAGTHHVAVSCTANLGSGCLA